MPAIEYHGWQSWAGPAPATPGPAGWWAPGYWCRGYFGGLGAFRRATAPPAASLVGAVRDRLRATIGDRLPGGVWNNQVPPRATPPYAVLVEVAEGRDHPHGGADFLADGILQVSAYAVGRTPARELAQAAEDALNHAPLAFAAGRLMLFEGAGRPVAVPDPERAPGRAQLWQEARTYRYVYQGSDG